MEGVNKVATYTIKQNLLMLSTNPMPIYDENHNIIGYVKKFYKSLGEKIFAYLSGRPVFNNLQAEDTDGNIQIRVKQSILFFRRAEWQVELYSDQQKGNSFILRDNSLITAGKTLAFEYKGRQITVENNNLHYTTRFIDNSKDVIAQCDCKSMEKSFDINIQVFKPELDIYQIATLGLIQYYWGMYM